MILLMRNDKTNPVTARHPAIQRVVLLDAATVAADVGQAVGNPMMNGRIPSDPSANERWKELQNAPAENFVEVYP